MLRKTVLLLKSPTGAFIAPLRCANANLFNKVQEKLAKNKKAPARHKAEESYLLTTKLYCGKCGALMFGESGVSHTGKMYTYYKCAAAKKKKTCDKKAVRKQWLEDLVVNETMKLVEDDASMNAIIAKVMELQNQESTDLPIYEKQLKETEVGITNMLNAIQMGILTSSTKERLEALEDQRKELQVRIAEERLAKPKMKEEFVRFWLLRFRKLDMTQPEQRQALVDTFINAIYLYDDKVLITFNYKEGTETVAFGEAVKAEKSSDMSARGAPRKTSTLCVLVFLFRCERGLEKGGGALRRKQSPSGVLLSLRFPTRRNIYREDCRKNRKSEPFLDRRRVRIFCFRVEYIPWRAARVTPSGWLPAALGIALRFSSYRVGHLWRSALPPTHKWTPPQRPYRSCKWTGPCFRCFP